MAFGSFMPGCIGRRQSSTFVSGNAWSNSQIQTLIRTPPLPVVQRSPNLWSQVRSKGRQLQKAVGYIRVSTDGQAVEGVSLDAQRSRIEAWCTANEFQLVAVHVDAGLSGKRADNRPELQAALAAVASHKAALVVYSLSRLARSTKDTISISERISRAGGDLVSLSEKIDTTTAAGKMVFQMLAVLAEFERNQISERTTAAMAHMRDQGRFLGQVPFGYDLGPDGETLVVNATETDTIRRIVELRAQGHSLRKIATHLETASVPTKSGNSRWTHTAVRSILNRAGATLLVRHTKSPA